MTKRFLAISILSVWVLWGCNKEKKQDPYITAKAGVDEFYASGGRVTRNTQKYSSYTSATVEGTAGNGATIRLWIKDFTGKLEVYQLDSTEGAATYLPPTPSIEKPSARGFVYIQTVTPRLTGFFFFKCIDSTEVSGMFGVDAI